MDPRIHARLLAVRRHAARRRRRWLTLAAGVLAVAAAIASVSRTPLLAVHHVRVTGGLHTTRASVLAATGLGRQPLMVSVSSGRLRRDLSALPWVAGARISRRWPTTVDIRLTERVPVARLPERGGGTAVVDRTGRVLSVAAPNTPALNSPGVLALPAISGLQPAGPPGTTVQAAPLATGALLVAASVPGKVGITGATGTGATGTGATGGAVQAVVVTSAGLQLSLSNGPSVILGTADQLSQKLVALRTMLDRVDLRGVATIDVRVPDEPVLTRAPQSTTVPTSRG